jgi:hypothetical protein
VCKQEKYEENDLSAQKVHFGRFCAFREFGKSTVTFSHQNDTGHYFSEVDFKTVRRIRNNISNTDNFAGEPPL